MARTSFESLTGWPIGSSSEFPLSSRKSVVSTRRGVSALQRALKWSQQQIRPCLLGPAKCMPNDLWQAEISNLLRHSFPGRVNETDCHIEVGNELGTHCGVSFS